MTSHDEENDKRPPSNAKQLRRSAFVGLQAGCLTFLIAGTAIIVGWLVDTRLGTFPRWTLILLIGSAPITLGGIYFLVRRVLKNIKKAQKDNYEEE